ncbi:MAG: tetratricopeptide repeat protein [Fimbriiglobus sp.]
MVSVQGVTLREEVTPNHYLAINSGTIASPSGYELLEEIGRGGMGVVFRARDIQLERDVAIKVLLQQSETIPEDSLRFFREKQITAQLQHPGIPPVHQIGTSEDGQPYLVMKLVQGCTLEDLCQTPAKINKWQLFDGICNTLAYAHMHGVIHRDLKPQNIMIGQFGEVQVMDWGMAKRLDTEAEQLSHESLVDFDSSVTNRGVMVGTLGYMPPEQAEGNHAEIGPWSDVFGLGGILLFLLTGRPPYIAATLPELREKVKSADLEDAYHALIDHSIEPDLAILAMRCLSRSRLDRPQNASEVVLELDRLELLRETRLREMELAKVAASTHEAERHKRHILRIRYCGLLAIVLVMGLVLTTSLMFRARRAEEHAATERDVALQKEQIAANTKEFLQSILRQTSAEGQASKKRVANPDLTLKEALDFAAHQLGTQNLQSPLTEADLRTTIGIAYSQLKQHPQALEQLERALELRKHHLGGTHSDTAETITHLCALYSSMGRFSDSEKFGRESLEILQAKFGPEHLKTLKTRILLASALSGLGNYDSAEREYLETLKVLVARHGETHVDTLSAKIHLGLLYFNTKQYSAAEPLFAEVITAREASLGRDHPHTLVALSNMAGLKQVLQKPQEAEELLREVLSRREKSLGRNHPDTISSISNLGGLMMSLGKWQEAREMNERAYQARLNVLEPDHPDTAQSIFNLGDVAHQTKDYRKALDYFSESFKRREKVLGAEHPDTLVSAKKIAHTARKLGDWNIAEQYYGCIAEVVEKQHFKSQTAMVSMNNYAGCLEASGKYREAIVVRKKWLTELRSRPTTPPSDLILSLMNLGRDELLARDAKNAIPYFKEAEALALSAELPSWQLAQIRFKLGEAALQLGNIEEARDHLVPNHQILIDQVEKLPNGLRNESTLVMIRYYETIKDQATAQKLRDSLRLKAVPIQPQPR